MPRPLLLRHPSSLEHDTGPHPERAARIVAIETALAERDWLEWEVRESPEASRRALEAVHDPVHVDRIERFCARGGGMIDIDTVASSGSWRAALHAAGGAIALVDALLGGEARAGTSLHRPPGHHAERDRAMGFCLFDNVAVGAQHALDAHAVERVLILDWDVHHGNGTNQIFHATDQVLFASIHESPLYPGTGPAGDVGSGRGEGFTANMPVPHGSGDAVFCSLVEHVVVPLGRAYRPQLVLISAGFDAHAEDPLAGCAVSDAGYAAMAAAARRLADELDAPLGVVLEGGYALAALARSLLAVLAVVGAEEPPPPVELPVHPLAAQALDRLGSRWPDLRPA